ncbi:alcohol dehydrogenase catalytic domain-containing protein [Oceanimonas doudoroffii]|uniref:Alcohol dehydrogenase-like N-terminal domain-containing protein n=1 Tax=Oceanimonas doudoroffii TaxID=84158 RepID=A0A233RIH4_9GAMM|nr:alcohol dehydrogenase catalytic domain-containing protein [Oceanimonas doudoroffii]OXY83190.1 hypothetical protein B6S08_06750 [Oceanimonas doudoroffii]
MEDKFVRTVRVCEDVNHFEICSIEKPKLKANSALVRMEAAFLPPYMEHLPGGGWPTPPRPFTPGQCAIGVVEAVDDRASQLKVGQRVYCDMYIESHGAKNEADHGFIGCFGVAEGAAKHLAEWPDGSFGEYICAPTECFTPVPEEVQATPEVLCRLGWFGTAYAGLERGGFKPGMTVAVNGASGLLGTSAAMMALALGAGEVQLFGRREPVLEEIQSISPRCKIGKCEDSRPIDLLIDCAGGDNTALTEQLIGRLRRFGNAVFIGALTAPLSIDASILMRNGNSLIGSFWFPRETAARVLSLVATGVLDLSLLRVETYSIDEIEDAVKASVENSGGLFHIALTS